MGIKQITYQPRSDVTAERERSVLAECYRIILEDHAAQETIDGGDRNEVTAKDATGVNAD